VARLAAETADLGSAGARDRRTLGALAAVCAIVRDGLARAGLDPQGAAALRLAEAAASRLAGHGETAASKRADAALAASDDEGSAGIFAAKIGDLARRCPDGGEPDLANASLAELFAWCLTRGTPPPAPPAATQAGISRRRSDQPPRRRSSKGGHLRPTGLGEPDQDPTQR
jgi:hypothetical protein